MRLARETGLDVLIAFRSLPCDVQLLDGERDETAEWGPLVEAAEERGCEVLAIPGDHFFVGQDAVIATAVTAFFERGFV